MGTRKQKSALSYLRDRYIGDDPKRIAELEDARESAKVARQVFKLREGAGLTQRALAAIVGTSASVISRLEDDDYDGHSLKMLRRIAAALDHRVEVRFVAVGVRRAKKKTGRARGGSKGTETRPRARSNTRR